MVRTERTQTSVVRHPPPHTNLRLSKINASCGVHDNAAAVVEFPNSHPRTRTYQRAPRKCSTVKNTVGKNRPTLGYSAEARLPPERSPMRSPALSSASSASTPCSFGRGGGSALPPWPSAAALTAAAAALAAAPFSLAPAAPPRAPAAPPRAPLPPAASCAPGSPSARENTELEPSGSVTASDSMGVVAPSPAGVSSPCTLPMS
mmetsp:Transcript_9139/g.22513  ORF Transcript_9139/g.22513 Transcript_9139/m.22513 type:complete len:204 (-) Transcript_9139:1829-2440(-)